MDTGVLINESANLSLISGERRRSIIVLLTTYPSWTKHIHPDGMPIDYDLIARLRASCQVDGVQGTKVHRKIMGDIASCLFANGQRMRLEDVVPYFFVHYSKRETTLMVALLKGLFVQFIANDRINVWTV